MADRANFLNFEFGPTGETYSTAGSPSVQSTVALAGTYSALLPPLSNIAFAHFSREFVGSDVALGNDLIIGFLWRCEDVTPNLEFTFLNVQNSAGSIHFRLRLATNGNLVVHDANDTQVASVASGFVDATTHRIEVRFRRGDPGVLVVKVDGSVILTRTTDDYQFTTALSHLVVFSGAASGGPNVYVDDIYIDHNASSNADFLSEQGDGTWGMSQAYGVGVGDGHTELGDAPDAGGWPQACQIPYSAGEGSAYTANNVLQSGGYRTDGTSGSRFGPAGDGALSGKTLLAAKYVHVMAHSGTGSDPTYYRRYGNSVDGMTDEAVTLPLSPTVSWFQYITADAGIMPAADEYFESGMRKDADGPNNILLLDSYNTILFITPAAGIVVSPAPASAIGQRNDPGVQLGSLSIAPGAAAAIGQRADPVIVLGSLSIAPAAAFAIAVAIAPAVELGDVLVTPAAAAAIAGVADPTIEYSSTTASPAPATALGNAADPGVILGSLTLAPAAAQAIAIAIDPAVTLGDIVVVPAAAAGIGGRADPTIVLSSLTVAPAAAGAIGRAADPAVQAGGDIAITPPVAFALGGSLAPAVELGDLVIAPAVAEAIGRSVDPTVDGGGVTTWVEDSFTEASDTDLVSHTPDQGTSWTERINDTLGPGVMRVFATGDYMAASASESIAAILCTAQPGPGDAEYDVECDIIATSTPDASDAAWVIGRWQNDGQGSRYSLGIFASGAFFLFRRSGGTTTLLDSTTVPAFDPTVSHRIKLEIRNATKKGYVDDVEYVSSADNTVTAAGEAGLGLGRLGIANYDIDTRWHFDNFLVSAPSLGDIQITPSAAEAIGRRVNPAVELGDVLAAPAAAAALGRSIDPAIALGDLLITPTAATAIARTLDPLVALGDITLTSSAAFALGGNADPTVQAGGDIAVAPAPAFALGGSAAPLVALGDIIVAPAAAGGIGHIAQPTAVLGSVLITPATATAIAATVDPQIVLGDVFVLSAAAAAIGRIQDPSVETGGDIFVTPQPAAAVGGGVINPTIIQSSIAVSPFAATAIARVAGPSVQLGSLTLTPLAAGAVALTIDPAITLGDVDVSPPSAGARGRAVAPSVLYGSTDASPAPATAVGRVAGPVVVLIGATIPGGVTVLSTRAPAVTIETRP